MTFFTLGRENSFQQRPYQRSDRNGTQVNLLVSSHLLYQLLLITIISFTHSHTTKSKSTCLEQHPESTIAFKKCQENANHLLLDQIANYMLLQLQDMALMASGDVIQVNNIILQGPVHIEPNWQEKLLNLNSSQMPGLTDQH